MDPADLADVETDAGLVRASTWGEPGGGARWLFLRGPLTSLRRLPGAPSDRALRLLAAGACVEVGLEVVRVSGPGVPRGGR